MSPDKNWILYAAAVISILLAILGGIMYPQTQDQNPFDMIGFVIGIPVVAILILALIYYRGLPNSEEGSS
jgi:ABC-type proline/glycine betaine transport system permease subunit